MKRFIILPLFLLFYVCSYSQTSKSHINVIGKATKNSILLRWSPDDAALWDLCNRYGYSIERIKISENGKVLKERVTEKLNQIAIKPAPLATWEAFVDEDQYVAVAAQAIYGETFELSEDFSSDITQVINKSREIENRFSFCIYSADQSTKAAEMSGLYFKDELIAPEARYLYRIYSHVPQHLIPTDTGYVFMGMDMYQTLPSIQDVSVDFQDQFAMISWNGGIFSDTYNSFWVERSDDGGNSFQKISDNPIVNTFNGDEPNTSLIFKLDSLPSNQVKYLYRVLGIDAFGEVGIPSDTVSGSGKPLFSYNSDFDEYEIIDNEKVKLTWRFPIEGLNQLKSFDVLRFNNKDKSYSIIEKDLPPNTRSYIDLKPLATNYYVISSNDKYGKQNRSYPYLIQLEDSIPPAPPIALKGAIDSTGLVTLSWNKNPENDLYGYKLYRANFRNNDFIELQGAILENNNYIDTIDIKSLTEKIYYRAVAFDNRFNSSEFSEILELSKPDIIPPNPPIFKEIKSDSSGIFIQWELSRSIDISQHLLYKRSEKESNWTLLKSIPKDNPISFFLDEKVDHKTAYAYTMIAVDDAGLESAPISPVSLKWTSKNPYKKIERFFFNVNEENKEIALSWLYEDSNISDFQVFKSLNGNPFKLVKSIEVGINQWIDNYTVKDQKLKYKILAVFKNGDYSKFSSIIEVEL